ncbi:MAG TPA: alpha/beta fold hydrolase [Polyangia bacterium]|nr:alpha/beta fold hydrolase [Polyangia bacterium]
MPVAERAGQPIDYSAQGPSGAPVVALLHNLLTDRTVFSAQVARLSERFRTLAIDLRGHGGTPARRPFAVRDLVEDVLCVLDREQVQTAFLCGISLGAQVGLELALAQPARVRGLVAMAPHPDRASARDRVMSTLGAAAVCLLGPRRLLPRAALPQLFGHTFRSQAKAEVAAWADKLAARGRLDTVRALRAWAARPALADRLARVRTRALVVVGEEDTAHPVALAERVQRAIPGARLALVARAGHTLTLENPHETGRLIEEFLA